MRIEVDVPSALLAVSVNTICPLVAFELANVNGNAPCQLPAPDWESDIEMPPLLKVRLKIFVDVIAAKSTGVP
jgi:hypothetical protein